MGEGVWGREEVTLWDAPSDAQHAVPLVRWAAVLAGESRCGAQPPAELFTPGAWHCRAIIADFMLVWLPAPTYSAK